MRGAIILACAILSAAAASLGVAADPSSTPYGAMVLEITGQGSATIHQATGANAVAEVIADPPRSGDNAVPKHLGAVRCEPLLVEVGIGDFSPLLGQFFSSAPQRLEIKLRDLNAAGQVAVSRELHQALLSTFQLPALDASRKDTGRIALTFQAESMDRLINVNAPAARGTAGRSFATSNFRLAIPGLDCAPVTRIESVSVKRKVVEGAVGEARSLTLEPGGMEQGNLAFTVPYDSAQGFYDWLNDFAIKGHNAQDREKTATLELLDTDMRTVLLTLHATGVGIFTVRELNATPKRAGVECYVRQWTLGGANSRTSETKPLRPLPIEPPPTQPTTRPGRVTEGV